jgi:hypothetical protein
VFLDVVLGRSLTRRQALRLGALATVAGALRAPVPALAARPPLFELDLSDEHAATASAAGWRTTRVLRAPRRFDLIGLRWADGAHAEAQVRARRRRGEWTAWLPLHASGDHGPDEGSEPAGTDPAFTGTADEFQLRLRGNPRGLRARFVRALPAARAASRRRRTTASASARRQVGTPPSIIPRAAWGADSVPPRAAPAYGTVQMGFVHHTVTANDYGPEDSAGIVLGIARYHRNSNGWNDIGYNFLVDKYGQIFEGRAGGIDQPVIGAQAQGYNSVSTGVACLGTFSSVAQTEAGMEALAHVLGWKLALHGVPTQGELTVVSAGGESNRYSAGTPVTFQYISGHRDGDNTSCPGSALYAQLDDLRTRAARYAIATNGLTTHASTRRLRAHHSVALSGALHFADGASTDGAPLTIEFQAAGSAFTPIASATCVPGGGWGAKLTPPTSGVFRAVYAGDTAHGRVESKPVRVDVIPHMTIAISKRRMRRRKTVKVTGTIDPAQLAQIVVERRSGRRWALVRSRRLKLVNGRYAVKVQLNRAGRYRITVIADVTKRRRIMRVT